MSRKLSSHSQEEETRIAGVFATKELSEATLPTFQTPFGDLLLDHLNSPDDTKISNENRVNAPDKGVFLASGYDNEWRGTNEFPNEKFCLVMAQTQAWERIRIEKLGVATTLTKWRN